MNKYIKKSKFSYLQRGLFKRKLKTKFTILDLINLYLSNFDENNISITTYKNHKL